MKNAKGKIFTGILASAAMIGCMSMISAADSWKDGNGDEFVYKIQGYLFISDINDDGDGKVVVPEKIADQLVYSLDNSMLSRCL